MAPARRPERERDEPLPPRPCFLDALAYYAALGAERIRLTAEAEHAEALREAGQLKDASLASVSHDIRTPPSTIRALAHDLATGVNERVLVSTAPSGASDVGGAELGLAIARRLAAAREVGHTYEPRDGAAACSPCGCLRPTSPAPGSRPTAHPPPAPSLWHLREAGPRSWCGLCAVDLMM